MTTVAQILAAKRIDTTYTISPEATTLEAVKLMAAKNVGALVVMQNETVSGIITERDYARSVALAPGTPADKPVRNAMTAPVVCVHPGQTNQECMALMTEKRLRHLPVVDRGRLVGIVSIGDLVKDIIAEQRFTIEQREHYIMG